MRTMRTIAVLNMKGGVGKTTTVINLAHILANDYRRRVLVVDCDPQCNTTEFYGVKGEECINVSDLLQNQGESCWIDCVVNISPYLYLLPATTQLWQLDLTAYLQGPPNVMAFRDFLAAVEEDNEVDVVLFDCPPGFTSASIAALSAAKEVIIPLTVDGFAFEGLSKLMPQLESMRKVNPALSVSGVLITQWRNTELVTKAEEELRKCNLPVFAQTIRRTEKVPESTVAKNPVVEYSATSAATKDYRMLAKEIFGEVPDHGETEA